MKTNKKVAGVKMMWKCSDTSDSDRSQNNIGKCSNSDFSCGS